MPESTNSSQANKPAKPYEVFALFAHATRRWAKKIRGKLHYFGPWRDPQAALERFNRERPFLSKGRTRSWAVWTARWQVCIGSELVTDDLLQLPTSSTAGCFSMKAIPCNDDPGS